MRITPELWDRVDADKSLTDEQKYAVLAALEGEAELRALLALEAPNHRSRPSETDVASNPVPARLKSLTVAGFRGIGATASLSLSPTAGLTVICGRNGSGKSSFAEALDIALRRETPRAKKNELWGSWRNLHQPKSSIRVGLTTDGAPPIEIGVDWADDETDWEKRSVFTQQQGAKRVPGRGLLDWESAMATYPPLLGYEELGSMLDGPPSKLHDALHGVLGMREYEEALKRLEEAHRSAKPTSSIRDAKSAAMRVLEAIDDPRAAEAAKQLSRHSGAGAEGIKQLVAGGGAVDPDLYRLRQLAGVSAPDRQQILATQQALIDAQLAIEKAGAEGSAQADEALSLLRRAKRYHEAHGDAPCPVCAKGELDEQWAVWASDLLARDEARRTELKSLHAAKSAADEAWRQVRPPLPHELAPRPGIELPSLGRARFAWESLLAADARQELGPVLDELEAALFALTAEANEEFERRQDAWAPAIQPLGAWLSAVEEHALAAPRLEVLAKAVAWVKELNQQVQNERLAPLADEARRIWSLLRQESNVDLGSVELTGTKTKRRVELSAQVDGIERRALSVMSQGELHALALALFIPRATMPESPFGFVVLDDPIQAMDPSKVDGFVDVLFALAETKQVIVFSHDDRLPAALRRSSRPARILEIVRDTDSVVQVVSGKDPVDRYLDDAYAVIQSHELTDQARRRVLPGLFRLAVEYQARELFVRSHLKAGVSWAQIDQRWAQAKSTAEKVKVALDKGKDFDNWLNVKPYRRRALGVVTSAAHEGLNGSPDAALHDVREFLIDLGAELK